VGVLPDGTPYFVSPFVKGTTLGQHLKAEGRLEASEVRRVVREVSAALAAAHRLDILHRDVRPDNILREDETGTHYLCDFGLAGVLESGEKPEIKLTRTGEVLGDPAYISPEQMKGIPLTDRADIYSLGILAHELLTGRCPPVAQARDGARPGDVVPPDLRPLEEYLGETDPELLDLVRRCLATEPTHRPTAADVSRKCEERAAEPPWQAPPIPGPVGRLLAALIRRRFLQIIGAYIAGSWILLEATDQMEGRALLPELAYPLALTTVVFGFIGANVLAWHHGQKGKQDMTRTERVLLGLVGVGWVVACAFVLS
jgi:serine/threonine protein kinase